MRAGIFFLGYFLFEVPSNLVLQKIGAKKTIMRITLGWGIVSVLILLLVPKFREAPKTETITIAVPETEAEAEVVRITDAVAEAPVPATDAPAPAAAKGPEVQA
ncbi:hypothetical protein [Microbacterium neungamense]|uniref:hypothetical protein n=1 Tax=Microbacterium TaxID=33882 RepID=UPI00308B1451|nr:hypothetical protein JSY13_02925 [Microbacterium neungamense]WCM56194.1 hypothetical protein JRG78_02950 [Microbacterium sp. EF45047]